MPFHRGLSLLAMSALVIGCARTVNVDQERNALLSADQQASEATTDLDKFLGFYAADASVYPPGAPMVTGSDAIKALFTHLMTPGMTVHWTPAKAQVSTAGDVGYTTGAYQVTAGGASEKGKYVTVWKKQADGGWKMAEDIFNADAAMQPPPSEHKVLLTKDLSWGDAPPGLPRGAKVAVLSGDPSKSNPYVLRAQMPAGYTIPAHWHPTDEQITVLSGTFAVGMGDKFDAKKLDNLPVGSYALMPATMHHYAMARTAAVIQVHGMGPFAITYVDPADDPRKETPK
jgi:ketosteroid isomerase-like protein